MPCSHHITSHHITSHHITSNQIKSNHFVTNHFVTLDLANNIESPVQYLQYILRGISLTHRSGDIDSGVTVQKCAYNILVTLEGSEMECSPVVLIVRYQIESNVYMIGKKGVPAVYGKLKMKSRKIRDR
jgi:hypothetical protein